MWRHQSRYAFLLLLGWAVLLQAQPPDRLPGQIPGDPGLKRDDFGRISIPFEYENDLIVLRVIFNGTFPLRFIFDTGSEQTVLLKREVTDILGVPYVKRLPIIGSDLHTDLYALIIRNIHLRIDELNVDNYSMLVLEEDYFRFEEATGIEVQGILGAAVFDRFVVKIDYRTKTLTLIRPEYFKPPGSSFAAIDLRVSHRKPYVDVVLQWPDGSRVKKHLLLDTGAGLPLLLHYRKDSTFRPPENWLPANIGRGLGGYLEGYVGRANTLELGPYAMERVLVNYQFLSEETDTSFLNLREGILGNQLLKRFTVIIDYPNKKLYLRPNRNFKAPFRYDKSGLIIMAGGKLLTEFVVKAVVPGSPAAEAGILPGDRLAWINGRTANLWSLSSLHKLFEKRSGKKIRLRIRRGDRTIKVQFRLRELV